MNRKAEGFDRRKFIAGGAGLLAAAKLVLGQRNSYADSNFAGGPIPGPFRPNWESLKAYRYPDWFRDAKFGIWAHWSPQCVPEQGDWYARGMYVQGNAQYNYHVKTYGHPSQSKGIPTSEQSRQRSLKRKDVETTVEYLPRPRPG